MNATTRRSALLGSALASLIGAPVVAKTVESSLSNPDAGLIALCAEFFVVDASLVRWEDDISILDQETGNALVRRWDSLISPIAVIGAVTAPGRCAKAAVALAVMRYADEVISTEHHDLVRSTLVDVIAGSAAA
jgi:hypothetical protein